MKFYKVYGKIFREKVVEKKKGGITVDSHTVPERELYWIGVGELIDGEIRIKLNAVPVSGELVVKEV